jgi:hypothetical protein
MSIKDIPERIGYLCLLFLHKQLSPLERKELDKWILEDDLHEAIFEDIINLDENDTSTKQERKGKKQPAPPANLKTR